MEYFVSGRRKLPVPDEPIPEEYKDKMIALMGMMDEFFNGPRKGEDRETGLILLTFPMNKAAPVSGQRVNYMSNGASREDVRAMFKEVLARWDGQTLAEGHA